MIFKYLYFSFKHFSTALELTVHFRTGFMAFSVRDSRTCEADWMAADDQALSGTRLGRFRLRDRVC